MRRRKLQCVVRIEVGRLRSAEERCSTSFSKQGKSGSWSQNQIFAIEPESARAKHLSVRTSQTVELAFPTGHHWVLQPGSHRGSRHSLGRTGSCRWSSPAGSESGRPEPDLNKMEISRYSGVSTEVAHWERTVR